MIAKGARGVIYSIRYQRVISRLQKSKKSAVDRSNARRNRTCLVTPLERSERFLKSPRCRRTVPPVRQTPERIILDGLPQRSHCRESDCRRMHRRRIDYTLSQRICRPLRAPVPSLDKLCVLPISLHSTISLLPPSPWVCSCGFHHHVSPNPLAAYALSAVPTISCSYPQFCGQWHETGERRCSPQRRRPPLRMGLARHCTFGPVACEEQD
mmetsp:Transcript_10496/g.27271  ORF Transcript_10496/g.27271 Transcript_10496/m.27271 type:complete len:211 (+) Transcript_10496:1256-1888(+)